MASGQAVVDGVVEELDGRDSYPMRALETGAYASSRALTHKRWSPFTTAGQSGR